MPFDTPPGLSLEAARKLHAYLRRTHLNDFLLVGPDPGIRLELRLWRFLKSYASFLPWHDSYTFLQTQGYWCLANWKLFELTGESNFQACATQAARKLLDLQTPDGYWTYPLPQRRHRIATIEGNWAALALIETYEQLEEKTLRDPLLKGARRWYEFLISRIGFQEHETGRAVNYFDRPRGKVPNNSVSTLYFLARLSQAAQDSAILEHGKGLVEFLTHVQLSSGEFPYIIESPQETRRDHYLCFQYNAFQFLELAWTFTVLGKQELRPVLDKLAGFLAGGVSENGASRFDCFRRHPEVNYYTAVLGAAMLEAHRQGLGDYAELGRRCFRRLLDRQQAEGNFEYSEKDYGLFRDRRSYPRYQAMILFHLLWAYRQEKLNPGGVPLPSREKTG